jgi:dihydroorotase
MTESLTIRRPDDWHLHLRDGAMLPAVLPETARHFARAIIMPNLVPPVVTGDDARAYRDRIMAALPGGMAFTPLMTLYLTETTDPADVAAAHAEGLVTAVKLYPAGATTNSASGVRDLDPRDAGAGEDGRDRPAALHPWRGDDARGRYLRPREGVPRHGAGAAPPRSARLKVTLEHITTADGIAYVGAAAGDIAGTITTHHLMINRNHMLVGGIRPHYYCLPVAKRARRTSWRCGPPRPRAIRASSSAPTARRIPTRQQGNRLRLRGRVLGHQHDELPRPCVRGGGRARRLEGFASLHGPRATGWRRTTRR